MNQTAFVGNLVRDPELRTSGSGTNRATFTVAVNEGDRDKGTEKTHFVDVTAFGTLGENLAASLRKGHRVLVIGRLDTYKKDVAINGEAKAITMVSFIASAVGPDLRWQTAQVAKVESNRNANQPQNGQAQPEQGNGQGQGQQGNGQGQGQQGQQGNGQGQGQQGNGQGQFQGQSQQGNGQPQQQPAFVGGDNDF